jgi:hypothetical protein
MYNEIERIFTRSNPQVAFEEGLTWEEHYKDIVGFALIGAPKKLAKLRRMLREFWTEQEQGRGKRPLERADFVHTDVGWRVLKFYRGLPPLVEEKGPDFDVDQALNWCRDNGWDVRRVSQYHARAWVGPSEPVRSRRAILRRREELDACFNGAGPVPGWVPKDIREQIEAGTFNVRNLDVARDL